jgi:hypothetical protein
MFDRKFILYNFFLNSEKKKKILFFTTCFCSIIPSQRLINSCLDVIVSCTLGGHVHITDKCCFMNGLLFHFRRREGHSYNELNKWSKPMQAKWQHCVEILAVCIRMKSNEGCGCQTDKVRPQFSGSTASKKQTFSRSVALLATWRLLRWRLGVDKRHSRTNNKEFVHNMTLRYWLASLRQSLPHT